MMSPVAERIYAKINILIRERDEVSGQINKLKHTMDDEKKHMHHTELEIVAEGTTEDPDPVLGIRLARELKEFKKEKDDLRSDEKTLQDLNEKYKNLTKTIEDHTFWMHRADTTDPVRQREAEKKIFG